MKFTRPPLVDIALAVALGAFGVIGLPFTDDSAVLDRHVDAGAYVLVVLNALTLVYRRRGPLATLVVSTVLTTTFLALAYPYGPIFFPFLVAGYTAARYLRPQRSTPAAAAALLVLLSHLFTNEASLPGLLGLIPATAWVVVPFALGLSRRLYVESLERERAEAVRQRVGDERLRVAQEVHDVVGHGLAAIKMQADLALHLLARKPEQAEASLTAISRTSSEALDELRATLAVVRHPDPDTRSPSPGLGRLEDLRQRMAEAGVDVRLDTSGAPRDLSTAADLAGYRVVQESLTNVLKHSEAKVADVRVGYETDAVVIIVSNPAPLALDGQGGLGIAGMRERVTSLGGEFSAGPTTDGRFEVRAAIPAAARP